MPSCHCGGTGADGCGYGTGEYGGFGIEMAGYSMIGFSVYDEGLPEAIQEIARMLEGYIAAETRGLYRRRHQDRTAEVWAEFAPFREIVTRVRRFGVGWGSDRGVNARLWRELRTPEGIEALRPIVRLCRERRQGYAVVVPHLRAILETPKTRPALPPPAPLAIEAPARHVLTGVRTVPAPGLPRPVYRPTIETTAEVWTVRPAGRDR